ncbi:MAG: transposase, partial [Treponema sp.]|nr:transposase [Treponema sp.]
MENGTGLHMREEFAGLDFNSKRLEQRFVRTMETLAGQPDKSIWSSSENRAEASETKFPQQYTECRATRTWTGKKYCGH